MLKKLLNTSTSTAHAVEKQPFHRGLDQFTDTIARFWGMSEVLIDFADMQSSYDVI